jgi:paraquat-inducible protein A
MSTPSAMQHGLIACEHCDAVYRRVALAAAERAHCPRCGTLLYRHSATAYRKLLPLVCAALVLFAISNTHSLVEMDIQGTHTQATLLGAAQALYRAGMGPVAALVFLTTILLPLLELLMLLYLLLPLAQGRRPAGFKAIVRAILQARRWGMLEVFMVGVLVSLAKLSHIAQVIPGIALWSFAALVVVLAVLLAFDPRELWAYLEAGTPAAPPPAHTAPSHAPLAATATALGLLPCHACNTLSPLRCEGAPCARCGAPLHRCKPDSLARSWAFLGAAAILYLPANLLPIMVTQSVFGTQQDTIFSGVVYLWLSGSQSLALVVLVASIVVPLMKMLTLALLLASVHRGSRWSPRERTRLYGLVEAIGRWSMLDIFVVALLAALVQAGALASIAPGTGAMAFAAVVVLTMLASHSFDPRLLWGTAREHTYA